MKVLFWIITILLMMVFITAFISSTSKDRSVNDRQCDVFVGAIVFIVFIVLIKVFGGLV